jgi:hypothetical protein
LCLYGEYLCAVGHLNNLPLDGFEWIFPNSHNVPLYFQHRR